MSNIDTVDERILSELQHNGRLTMKALAERVGLSSPAMIERVRRLEERGVLAGYRAVIDPAAIGRSLTAIIFADVERRYHEAFLSRLRSESSVEECARTTNAFMVKVHVTSAEELEQLIDELSDVGAKCDTRLILSMPIEPQPINPPEGSVNPRTRLSRRRRRPATSATTTEEGQTTPRRRGRKKALDLE